MKSRIVTYQELSPKIFHFQFPTDYLMSSSFIRFQEHYESARYKGKVFSLEEYMDYYAEKMGTFTYFADCSGMNFPSYGLLMFYEGRFHPLSTKEQIFLDLFRTFPLFFYVIATSKESKFSQDDLNHELAHALFYLNDDYRAEVKALLKGHKFKEIKKYLRDNQYHHSIYNDEIQAYLTESAPYLRRIGVQASQYKKLRKDLKDVFNHHFIAKRSKREKITL